LAIDIAKSSKGVIKVDKNGGNLEFEPSVFIKLVKNNIQKLVKMKSLLL